MIELCKSIARKHEQKLRLDYEIVRALKCAELQQKGFETSTIDAEETFTFKSPFPTACSCVITNNMQPSTQGNRKNQVGAGLQSVSASNFVINRDNDFGVNIPFFFLAIGR